MLLVLVSSFVYLMDRGRLRSKGMMGIGDREETHTLGPKVRVDESNGLYESG